MTIYIEYASSIYGLKETSCNVKSYCIINIVNNQLLEMANLWKEEQLSQLNTTLMTNNEDRFSKANIHISSSLVG